MTHKQTSPTLRPLILLIGLSLLIYWIDLRGRQAIEAVRSIRPTIELTQNPTKVEVIAAGLPDPLREPR